MIISYSIVFLKKVAILNTTDLPLTYLWKALNFVCKLNVPVLSSSKFYDNSIATDGTVELLQALAASEVLGALQLA